MPEPVSAPASAADLYQLEPNQFTAARNALAKQIKAEGRSDEAARVGKLRRPPVTAWALNQVARLQPDLVGGVLATGDRLRSAMQQAVDGDASGLRDAQAAQRGAVDAAVSAAAARLVAAGHPDSETAKQRMAATMGAAVVDDTVADELRRGVLDGDRSAPGFGLDALVMGDARVTPVVPSPKPVRPPEKKISAHERKAEAPERERRRQARARYAELEAEAARLAHKADRLAVRAEEAERQAAAARSAADDARAEADDARRQADAAKRDDEA